jgi:hypothetical protein
LGDKDTAWTQHTRDLGGVKRRRAAQDTVKRGGREGEMLRWHD